MEDANKTITTVAEAAEIINEVAGPSLTSVFIGIVLFAALLVGSIWFLRKGDRDVNARALEVANLYKVMVESSVEETKSAREESARLTAKTGLLITENKELAVQVQNQKLEISSLKTQVNMFEKTVRALGVGVPPNAHTDY